VAEDKRQISEWSEQEGRLLWKAKRSTATPELTVTSSQHGRI